MALDEPMAPHIYDKLTSCDPGLAWELCRNYIGYQLLGRDAVTVPFLDEAYHVVPFGVVVKKSKKTLSVPGTSFGGSSRSSYAIIGSLANLTAPHVDKAPFRQRAERVYDYNFNDKFVYRISGMKNGVKKAVKIKINGTECFDVSLSMELGKLVLDKRLEELDAVKKIFIIFEVFFANSVSVSVTIGEQQPGSQYMDTTNRKFAHDRRMPIGFNAQKFPLMANGCVGFTEKTNLEGLREGRWKRSTRLKSDPLPRVPSHEAGGSWNTGGPIAVRRNPQDILPGVPGQRRNDPLPAPPQNSDSSD
ncbi:uncharacterized protein C11orf42-like [Styela clava]